MTRALTIATIAVLGFVSCGAPAKTPFASVPSLNGNFDRGKLTVQSDDGVHHELDVYLAITFEQQRRGLMFVRNLPDNTGMLFVYEDVSMHSMWMKNTYIPLDMVFARADGSVSSVIHDTRPLSLTSQGSIEPVTYVLELNAGTARRLNIGQKSRITWEALDAVSAGYPLCSVAAIESAR